MARITRVEAHKILDSRGDWTVEVELGLSDGTRAQASAPQGRSRGTYEAECVDSDRAIENVRKFIAPELRGKSSEDQQAIDKLLTGLDGTARKSNIGANAILAISCAVARVSAITKGVPLWKYLRRMRRFNVDSGVAPKLLINVINGGLHAGNNLDFQEYLVIPKAESVSEAVTVGIRLYHSLGENLVKKLGGGASAVGDEGGFSPNFKDNEEPFVFLRDVVKELGLEENVDFGLDAAATNIAMTKDKLLLIYRRVKERYPLVYLEDPFGEEKFSEFAQLREEFGEDVSIVGDDLTTTNVLRMEEAERKKSVNGVIIKPNQIGTLSETLDAIEQAKKRNWRVFVSHRSGETNDDFIADLAYGVGADGIKLGSPARGERTAKYNRLLAIERSVA